MSPKAFSDNDIIVGLQNDHSKRNLFEEALYEKFTYFIDEGQKKFSLSREDAFSAYSDAVITTINNIINRDFEGRSSLKTYLFTIFHNKCVDQVRKNTTNKSGVHRTFAIRDFLHSISDTAKSIIQQLVDKTDIELLKSRLNDVGENCRKMLLLSAEGFSDKEIAEMMGFKTAAVAKTSRLRCLEKLRELYKNKQ